jgi:hypothetical protein
MMLVKWVAASAALCILILGLAVASNAALDRYEIAAEQSGGACVGADGAKYNWPWANAPTLWPPCPPDPTAPGAPIQGK